MPATSLPNTNPISLLENAISAGWTTSQPTSALQSIVTELANVAQEIGSDPSSISYMVSAANGLNTAAGVVAQDIATSAAVSTVQSDVDSMWRSANALLMYTLANAICANVAANGCSGADADTIKDYQTRAGIAATGIYDDATFASITTLIGSSAPAGHIPASCSPASGGGSGTTPPTSGGGTSTTTTTTTTSTSDSTTTALIVGAAVIAIGGLAVLLYQSGKASPALQTAPAARRRT